MPGIRPRCRPSHHVAVPTDSRYPDSVIYPVYVTRHTRTRCIVDCPTPYGTVTTTFPFLPCSPLYRICCSRNLVRCEPYGCRRSVGRWSQFIDYLGCILTCSLTGIDNVKTFGWRWIYFVPCSDPPDPRLHCCTFIADGCGLRPFTLCRYCSTHYGCYSLTVTDGCDVTARSQPLLTTTPRTDCYYR